MKDKLLATISGVLNIPVTEETTQAGCDKWDSLQHLNIIIALEDAFDVSFEPEEIAAMKSVKAIEQMLKAKLG